MWQSFTESKLIDKNVSDFGTIEQFILFFSSIWSLCENVLDDETLGFGIIEYFISILYNINVKENCNIYLIENQQHPIRQN